LNKWDKKYVESTGAKVFQFATNFINLGKVAQAGAITLKGSKNLIKRRR